MAQALLLDHRLQCATAAAPSPTESCSCPIVHLPACLLARPSAASKPRPLPAHPLCLMSSVGVELNVAGHKSGHAYKVVQSLGFPLYHPGWRVSRWRCGSRTGPATVCCRRGWCAMALAMQRQLICSARLACGGCTTSTAAAAERGSTSGPQINVSAAAVHLPTG